MKKNLCFVFSLALVTFATGPLRAADASPKDSVAAAAAALAGETNYSWQTIVDMGSNSRFHPGPTDGKTEKGGPTTLALHFNENTTDVVIQGTNVAINTPDNGWRSAAEVLADDSGGGFNPAAFVVHMAQDFKQPAAEAASLAGQSADLQAGTNGISGSLTEAGANSLLTFRRRGADAPATSGAKGSVTFWLTDGKLVKYQTHVTGTVSFNGNDRDVDRTTTTEIKDVGTTKIEIPDDARKKLN